MTIQTAVLIETLAELGADVRWVSCNIFSTQDHAAAAVVVGRPETGGTASEPKGTPVFAWKGRDARRVLVVHGAGARVARRQRPDADRRRWRRRDAAGAQGAEFEKAGKVPAFNPDKDPEEWGVSSDDQRVDRKDKGRYTRIAKTIAASARRRRPASPSLSDDGSGHAALPRHQRERLGDQEQVRQHLRLPPLAADGLARATDVMLGGKVAVVFGFGEVGKGCARRCAARARASSSPRSTRSARCRRRWKATRWRPRRRRRDGRHLHHRDRQPQHHHRRAHARMKDKAIVGNIGHFDNEIDMAGLKKYRACSGSTSSRSTTSSVSRRPQRDGAGGRRLLNLGCATGHPSFVMSASFTNQVIAQLELHANTGKYEKKVYMLPKHLDEQVRAPASRSSRREADEADEGSGGLHRRAGGGTVQAGHYRY
jgi:adenosylhomocysteinase